MKKTLTALVAIIITISTFAQTPQKLSYQAVIRNSGNAIVANTLVGMQISIIKDSANGTVVYSETQTPTTNANGLVSIVIGNAAGFSSIDWNSGSFFIKTETDPNGGAFYTITGISQLLSVPYALHAKTAESVTGSISETDPTYTTHFDLTGTTTGDILQYDGAKYVSVAPGFSTNTHTHADVTPSISGFMSSSDKVKLDGISDGAEVNIQADWNQSSSTADDFIKNKPAVLGSQWTTSGSDIYYSLGNIGIGNSSPVAKLDVDGNIRITGGVSSVPGASIYSDGPNSLSFSTNGSQRMNINASGTVSINQFSGVGVVHNDNLGNLSSALITNSDISASAGITDTKLATISTTGKVMNAATTATSTNTGNAIVARDASGNFATSMITLSGTVANATDAATKAYVDQNVTLGLNPKNPAVAISTTNISLFGTVIIDGTSLVAGDRVLLTGQSNATENGLWVVQSGVWVRPTDFSGGSAAGRAYVLINSGLSNIGSSWLCETPLAMINTDALSFVQFSLPGQTTASNIGSGAGQVFRDKTGVTLNLKGISSGAHINVANNLNDIMLTSDAINSNVPNTIVSRDALGNFSANTISANLQGNVTGNLSGNASTSSFSSLSVNFTGSLSGEVSGIQSNTIVTSIGGVTASNITAGVIAANNATSAGIVNTIVKRDMSGNFSGNLTGASSLNVLKSGDNMTGNLTLSSSSQLRLSDAGTNYIALKAPSSVLSSYTLTLPTTAGINGNILSTDGTGTLHWINPALLGIISNGGNSFGMSINIGSLDATSLSFITNSSTRVSINSLGNVAIGATSSTSKLTISGGDINILDIGSGVIMKSPNGNCFRITVDNSGNLVSTAIPCP